MTTKAPTAAIAEANRLSKLLSLSRGSERFPVDVKELALGYAHQFGCEDPITNVIGSDLPGFEGALFRIDNLDKREWSIIFNSGITVSGRVRFTLAHELAHYILHRHTRDTFECSAADMVQWDSDEKQQEAEADLFASYLLMPLDDFRRTICGGPVDLDALDACATRYGVSLTAAILKWLEFTPERAVFVMSRDGYILWSRSSQSALHSGAYFRTRNAVVSVPPASLAANTGGAASERNGVLLAAGTWFSKEPRDMSVREMKIVSDRYEQTMSLLILPEAEGHWDSESGENEIELLDDRIRSGRFPR